MNEQSTIPVILTEGNAEDRGYQYGAQAKELIEIGLEMYHEMFKVNLNLEWDLALKASEAFIPAIKENHPEAIELMRGIAKGSGRSFEEIVLMNARSEIRYSSFLPDGAKRPYDRDEGCIAIAATPEVTLNGHMIIGKNVDSPIPMSKQVKVVLKEKRPNGVNVVAFEQEAGVIARAGINSAGLGALGTALFTDKMTSSVPNQVLCNKIMYCRTVSEAVLAVAATKRASSVLRIIANADGTAVMIEWAAPEAYNCILPEDGLLVGSLYFTGDNPDINDMIGERIPGGRDFFRLRVNTARWLLAAESGSITVDTFKKVLRDHRNTPASVCVHADNPLPTTGSSTVYSSIIDLTAKTMEIVKGNPCQNEYISVDLSDVL